MDKANLALAATEDNAAAIAKLQKAVAKRMGCREVTGVVDGTFSKLGEVTSNGSTLVIAAVPYTGKCSIFFNGENIRTDKTPLFALLPVGRGELKVQPPAEGVYAIIIGE